MPEIKVSRHQSQECVSRRVDIAKMKKSSIIQFLKNLGDCRPLWHHLSLIEAFPEVR